MIILTAQEPGLTPGKESLKKIPFQQNGSFCNFSESCFVAVLSLGLPSPLSTADMLMEDPLLGPVEAVCTCCSRRSSWKTNEFFSVLRLSSMVCFWISVSVSWWSRLSSSDWLLLLKVLLVSCRGKSSLNQFTGSMVYAIERTWTGSSNLYSNKRFLTG